MGFMNWLENVGKDAWKGIKDTATLNWGNLPNDISTGISDTLSPLTGGSGSAKDFNTSNADLARQAIAEQERYNTEMSNTAVQRRMEDLKKAGINPLLAGKFEASSPTASASYGDGNSAMTNLLTKLLSALL